VVSVYVPCIARTFGYRKVYCQQQKALLKMGKVGSVLKVFWEDLWSQVDTWREEGNQLIMAGDWNTDVRNKEFLQPFLERSMVPAITHQHGTQGPETFSGGSMPIDEIFCSSSLQVKAAGYLQHRQATGDHGTIWIDVTTDSFLGVDRQPLPSYKARRLKCQDPRIVAKYNTVLEKYLTKHGAYKRVFKLFMSHSNPLTPDQKRKYEKLDTLREMGMILAEKKCRKLKMGGLQWSPILQKARTTILYYKLTL
jgi:hypothetical protein